MATKTIFYICAIALLFQNASAYIEPSCDCIPPWARTFLAWREANTNIAGGRLSLLRNSPRLYSAICDENIPRLNSAICDENIPRLYPAICDENIPRLYPAICDENIPTLYSGICDDLPLSGYFPAGIPSTGGLAVTSVSNGPIGISVLSENIIEGPLGVVGDLPFLGTVGLGGALPTVGSGAVSFANDWPAVDALFGNTLSYNRFGFY